MIDRATGAVHFDGGVTIGPGMTRSEFLETSFGETREVWVENGSWCSWRVTRMKADRRTFIVVLQFQAERLVGLHLVESDLVGLGDWKDWSEAEELRKLGGYQRLLARDLGFRRHFAWGAASAVYDGKSGGSYLGLKYGSEHRYPDNSARLTYVVGVGLLLVGALTALALQHALWAAALATLAALLLVLASSSTD